MMSSGVMAGSYDTTGVNIGKSHIQAVFAASSAASLPIIIRSGLFIYNYVIIALAMRWA